MGDMPGSGIDQSGGAMSVRELAAEAGIVLRRLDEGPLVGVCPLCGAPDGLAVDEAANSWGCLLCGDGGGPTEWLTAMAAPSGGAAEVSAGGPAPGVSGSGGPFDAAAADGVVLGAVADRYGEALGGSHSAQAFLAQRGLASAEAVARFRIGFADRSLTGPVEENNRLGGKAVRDRFKELGVLRVNGREHLRGCVTFPVCDEAGRVVEIYGRRVGKAKRGSQPHLTLGDPPRGMWNVEALAACDEVVICESIIDGLTLWVHGQRNVVAVFGPDGFDDGHAETLLAHGIGRVVVAFDRDADGDAGADALAARLSSAGVVCLRAQLPAGSDINDVAVGSATPAGALADAIRDATWLAGIAKTATTSRTAPSQRPADIPATETGPADETGPATEAESVVSAAKALPEAATVKPKAVLERDKLRLRVGNRSWRVGGLAKNTSFDLLKVTVRVDRDGAGAGFHVDSLDLYQARARAAFIKEAAHELAVEEATIRRDLGTVLDECEAHVTEAIAAAQEPVDRTVTVEGAERAEALELLRDPRLVDRIADDFGRAGMVGERTNCLVAYLATVSRRLDRPLAVVVQSTSAAGKSALMDAVLDFVPEEDLVRFSAITGQALFYMGQDDLKHRVLAIAEEEGAERASYALKLLQSEGELTIASTGKDNSSGELAAKPYRVEGPTAIFMTTTAIDIDEELLNRCVVLTVNEDRDQTRAIHHRQRQAHTLDGLLSGQDRGRVTALHRNAQRLLEPVAVVNPYADRLTFADARTRTRRDHVKYLNLIATVTLLHQHQRPKRTVTHGGREVTYIETTLADIAMANDLAHEILGRSLDELPPQTRRVLEQVDAMVTGVCDAEALERDQVRLSRRQIREHTGAGDTALRKHLERLVDLELLVAHRTPGANTIAYELAWAGEGTSGRPFVAGLTDPATLAETSSYDTDPAPPGGTPAPRPHPAGTPDAPRPHPGSDQANGQVNGHNGGSPNGNGQKRVSGPADAEGPYIATHPTLDADAGVGRGVR